MSRVRNTQSRAQDELTRQQGKRKQAPGVPDNSRTVHAVPTKISHMWTQLERNRVTLKQSLKHQESLPTKHVNLRTPPRREYRMLFAEFSSRGGRSTPTSLQSPFRRHTQLFLCSPGKPWSVTCGLLLLCFVSQSVRTNQRLFSGTRLRISAGPRLPIPTTVLAHGRPSNQHHNHNSSSCPNTHHECGDRISRVHHSQSLRRSHRSLVPRLQRSHIAKCSEGRLQACSHSSPSPLFPEPSCQNRSDSPSCHSEPR